MPSGWQFASGSTTTGCTYWSVYKLSTTENYCHKAKILARGSSSTGGAITLTTSSIFSTQLTATAGLSLGNLATSLGVTLSKSTITGVTVVVNTSPYQVAYASPLVRRVTYKIKKWSSSTQTTTYTYGTAYQPYSGSSICGWK